MRIYIFALLSMFLLACGPEPTAQVETNDLIFDVDMSQPDALIEGTLGDSVDFSAEAMAMIDSQTDDMVRFSVSSGNYERAAMALFHVNGGNLNHTDFDVGSSWSASTQPGFGPTVFSPNGLEIIPLGCEGPQVNNWTLDEKAVWVGITVEPVDLENKRIYFDMDFEDVRDSMRGYLDVAR